MTERDVAPELRHNVIYWHPIATAREHPGMVDIWAVPLIPNATIGLGLRHPDCTWDNDKQAWFRFDIRGNRHYIERTPSKDGTMWRAVYWTPSPNPPGMKS
jgi:hypothetical protein